MSIRSAATTVSQQPACFRMIAAVAGLLTVAIGLLINVVLVPPAPGFSDIASYYSEEAHMLAVGTGLRFVAQFLLVIYGVGLYYFVGGPEPGVHRPWALLGLLGIMWVPAVGAVANSIEAVGVWQAASLADQPQLLTALWGLGIALFNGLLVPYALLMTGFSVSGRVTGVLPSWVMWLGFFTMAAGLLAAVGTISVMNEGWATIPSLFAYLVIPIWLATTSVLMLRSR